MLLSTWVLFQIFKRFDRLAYVYRGEVAARTSSCLETGPQSYVTVLYSSDIAHQYFLSWLAAVLSWGFNWTNHSSNIVDILKPRAQISSCKSLDTSPTDRKLGFGTAADHHVHPRLPNRVERFLCGFIPPRFEHTEAQQLRIDLRPDNFGQVFCLQLLPPLPVLGLGSWYLQGSSKCCQTVQQGARKMKKNMTSHPKNQFVYCNFGYNWLAVLLAWFYLFRPIFGIRLQNTKNIINEPSENFWWWMASDLVAGSVNILISCWMQGFVGWSWPWNAPWHQAWLRKGQVLVQKRTGPVL